MPLNALFSRLAQCSVLTLLAGGCTMQGDGSCNVTENGDGVALISCPDGSTAEFGALSITEGDVQDPTADEETRNEDNDVTTDDDGSGNTADDGNGNTADDGNGTTTDDEPGDLSVFVGDFVASSSSDLAALDQYSTIDGSLIIAYTVLTSSTPNLSTIQSITGDMLILASAVLEEPLQMQDPQFAPLNLLNNLTEIGGNLNIASNSTSSIAGFGSLTSVGGDLYIDEYGATLDGFGSLSSVGGDLTMQGLDLSTSEFNDFIDSITIGGVSSFQNGEEIIEDTGSFE